MSDNDLPDFDTSDFYSYERLLTDAEADDLPGPAEQAREIGHRRGPCVGGEQRELRHTAQDRTRVRARRIAAPPSPTC